MEINEDDGRSATRRCHFDGLAAVEVQTIMQLLDTTSLLRLARCSRRMLVDADSDAAWRTQPPYEVILDGGCVALVSSRLRRSLLSHVAATRVCPRLMDIDGPMVELLRSDIDAMMTLPRITEIDGQWSCIPTDEWPRILHHPAMADLTTLTTRYNVPQDIITHLVHLPRLHTLDFGALMMDLGSVDVSALPLLPSLTSLVVASFDTFSSPSLVAAIGACTHLTQLRLKMAFFQQGEFRRLFTLPNLSRLHLLELSYFDTTAVGAEEYGDAFAAMTHLRHLQLERVLDVGALLAGVSRAPHLATVEIRCTGPPVPQSIIPPADGLQSMIHQTEATSRVHVTLRLKRGIDSTPFASLDPRRFTLLTMK